MTLVLEGKTKSLLGCPDRRGTGASVVVFSGSDNSDRKFLKTITSQRVLLVQAFMLSGLMPMIVYENGDLLESGCVGLVNPVNCVGVMGAGLALEFKRRFPENFKVYEQGCRNGKVRLGRIFPFYTGLLMPAYLINFPTKGDFREKSRLFYISAGLDSLTSFVSLTGMTSLAVPALGCGLGGLKWENVEPLLREKLARLEGCLVRVYLPKGGRK